MDFLNRKAKSTLFTVTSLDSNNNFFIIGFAIVDVENLFNWTWFVNNLKNALKDIEEKILFLSLIEKKGLLMLFKLCLQHQLC